MTSRPASLRALLAERRIIAVVRQADAAVAEAMAHAVADGGVRVVEITMGVPGAASLIARLRGALADDVLVGAGTVLSVCDLEAVLAAGAQFVVSPGLDRGLVERCASARVATLPGVLSPTEAMAARSLGLDAVKLFPADTGGPRHLRALRAVFPDLAFVPTGGITFDDAAGWFDAGAHALGLAGEFDAAQRAGGEAFVRRLAARMAEAFETATGDRSTSGAMK